MKSLNQLPALHKLPYSSPPHRSSTRQQLADLVEADRRLQAVETSAAAAFSLWTMVSQANVDDRLFDAYEAAYPNLAADHSLYDHYQEVTTAGGESLTGFISGLKGKMAEFHAADILQQNGYTDVRIADDPTQSVWDISAIGPSGESVVFQVKTGSDTYAPQVESSLEGQADVQFMLSSEIYNNIGLDSPEYFDQMTDIGHDHILVRDVEDGLSTLSNNMGVDIPDGILEALPYAATIIAAARLMQSVIRTEKEFNAADRTTTNKVQVVRTVTLMSRFGVSSVLTMAGGISGAAAGSIAPVGGNVVGGIAGIAGGAVIADYLNKHLEPRMLDLALSITELTYDDLFYYKNKNRIDKAAMRFHETARTLAAPNRRLPAKRHS